MAAIMSLSSTRNILANSYKIVQVLPRRCLRRESLSNKHTNFEERQDWVVLAEGGSTVVCWHPEPKIPYECSLPLPSVAAESDGVLKTQLREDVQNLFHKKPEVILRKELMAITHTTKHRWFPHGERKYAKKTKPDREFL